MAIGGRYEIVAPLGRGGMARVVRAHDRLLDRQVALKLLASSATTELATRFDREARTVARLDHPSCVRILDRGPRYLVMELVSGTTLAAAIERGRFDEPRARRVTRAVLAALAHAHARGVIHRDVKPANVMLSGARPRVTDRSGPANWPERVVLIDFGLACVQDDARVTAVGACFGSPSYLAPERLLGRAYDARADLYAVGVMLYEMLTGMRPFAGETPEHTMQLALRRPPRPLRALRSDISPAIDAVVQRALAKDPAKRFADAEDMLAAIEELPAVPEPDHEPEPARTHDASSTIALIVRRPWWSRLWARLRYGRWRWA